MQRAVRWTSDKVTDSDDDHSVRRPRLLLLCDFRPYEAATVIDHIDAIRKWSRYDVFVLPTFGELPDELDLDAFDGLVIHYNLVMSNAAYLSPLTRWRVSQFRGVKAAFVQDEYRFVNSTVSVMRTLGINVLLTCVPEDQVELVYPSEALPSMKRKVTVLTGYVPEQLLSLPLVPYDGRTTDVGYRGRRLPAWLGRLAQEKTTIADRFLADAPAYGLSTDISTGEEDRLYGQAWTDFVSSTKATLGVESGASVFDFDGSVEQAVREFVSIHPTAAFEELHRTFLAQVEGQIRLNQISPRCFEAAALGTLMVLYPGEYSGILEPWRHYVPLQKDHSNMAEIVLAIRDRHTWERITKQARQEVALNPNYSFRAMVETVDKALDLRVLATKPIHPSAFGRLASRSYARLTTTRLRAWGLPSTVNRARLMASRAVRALKPSPIAIAASPERANGKAHAMRERWRYSRSLSYWILRPRLLPTAFLLAQRGDLLKDLSDLGRLQLMGGRALARSAKSPFALILDEGAHAVQIVLSGDVPPSFRPLPEVPRALSWAASVSLDLTDPWLVPRGVGEFRQRRLEALSAVLRGRPAVGRRLLAGRVPWCDVFELKGPTGS